MEEDKAAAYYDELTRKGEGAARFKQGLGFSSYSSDSIPAKPSSSTASSFSNFVRASSPGKAAKQAQLETIQAKLRRSRRSASPGRLSPEFRSRNRSREREQHGGRRRSSSRERRRERDRGHRSRSRERRRRSRSYSEEEWEEREGYRRVRNGKREKGLRRDGTSRSSSGVTSGRRKEHSDKVDYSRVIEGYSNMTPAERVKAKMKLQLSQTAAKDSTIGMSSGWERFDFNKDAPLDDDDDEIEVAEDDSSLVKQIGKSFRFSAVQAKHDEEIKAAHDEAMFGASAAAVSDASKETDAEVAHNEEQSINVLISDKVLARQQGGWRDRARLFKTRADD